MGEFKINKAAMAKLEHDLQKKIGGDLRVPKGGSEDDAVKDVVNQLKQRGLPVNEAQVRKKVREVRGG